MEMEISINSLSHWFLITIFKYLPYQEILKLSLVNKAFKEICRSEEMQNAVLREQYLVDNIAPTSLVQFLKLQERVFKNTEEKIKLYFESKGQDYVKNLITKLHKNFIPNFRRANLEYTNIGHKKNHTIHPDHYFLIVKAINDNLENNIPFGGIIYYHFVSVYYIIKDLPRQQQFKNITLYPWAQLGTKVIYVDLENYIGLGSNERYIILNKANSKLLLVNIKENFLEMKGNLKLEPFSYFDYFNSFDVESDCVTNGVRIRAVAKTAYDDLRFTGANLFFSYQIRISDGGMGQNVKVRLTRRKWIIQEFKDQQLMNEDIIQGDGVIGYYPEVFKNCEDFVYESCTSVNGTHGIMRGAFQFKIIGSGQRFWAQIKPFKLNLGLDKLVEVQLKAK